MLLHVAFCFRVFYGTVICAWFNSLAMGIPKRRGGGPRGASNPIIPSFSLLLPRFPRTLLEPRSLEDPIIHVVLQGLGGWGTGFKLRACVYSSVLTQT